MADNFKKAQLRVMQYQHVDGSFELTFGGAAMVMAICFYGMSRVAVADSFLITNILPFAPLVAFMGGVFVLDALVQRFRLRVTAQRSGYISIQKPRPLKRSTRLVIWIGIPILTVILLALLFLNRAKIQTGGQDGVSTLLPAFTGLLFGGLWIIAGWKIAITRFYVLAAISLLVSAWLFFDGVGGNTGMAVIFGAIGLALCISGGITLWGYLRNNRLPEDSSSGN